MIKILDRVVVDVVLLQKGVQFVAGLDSEQHPELIPGDASLPIGLQSDSFQRRAGRLLTGWQESCSQIVWNGDSYWHVFKLPHIRVYPRTDKELVPR